MNSTYVMPDAPASRLLSTETAPITESPMQIAQRLADIFAASAAERDAQGGTRRRADRSRARRSGVGGRNGQGRRHRNRVQYLYPDVRRGRSARDAWRAEAGPPLAKFAHPYTP